QCRELDKIVIATTTEDSDDPIEAFGKEHGVMVVRGSLDNVLRRYGVAARATRAGIIVRITGDAPLVDPSAVDRWVLALKRSGSDLVRTRNATPQIHEGICAFSRRALDYLLRVVPGDPIAREHVSSYFRHNPGSATVTLVDANPRHAFKGARLSIDTPADVEFIETVYREIGAEAGDLDVGDLVELLRGRPELLKINAHIHQKSATEVTRRVLVRCRDAHQMARAVTVGHVLRDLNGTGVLMAVDEDMAADASDFPMEVRKQGQDEESWVRVVLDRVKPDASILIDSSSAIFAAIGQEASRVLCCGRRPMQTILLGEDPEQAPNCLLSSLNTQTRAA
ncbi:MAG: spore coat polysaccharide biosynthesis protein SpsF, partial [Planctomycetota bacterium]